MVLNFVAIFKIITKAGYSGWWLLLPLAPLLASVFTLIVIDHQANSPFSTSSVAFDVTTIIGWLVFVGVSTFANWIFFLVFAFSDWPVRRQARQGNPYATASSIMVPDNTVVAHVGVPPAQWAPAPRPPPSAVRASCANCGSPVPPGIAFCGQCGTALAGV
jgi:hypothetical protein